MSFHGLGTPGPPSWLNKSSPKPPLLPFDYLTGGAGLVALQTFGTGVATTLASGKQGTVDGVGIANSLTIPADPIIAAIWGSSPQTAGLFGATLVNTLVNEQRQKPVMSRMTVDGVASVLFQKIKDAMLAKGDPASCMIDFSEAMNLWQPLYPALQSGNSWCLRNLILGGATPCSVQALCAQTLDSNHNAVNVSVDKPPPGSILMPPTASAIKPPPTHAQIDAQIDAQMNAACPPGAPTQYCGESFDVLEKAQEQAELATYLTALAQARIMFAMSLGVATNAADAVIWKKLADRGIQPAEAIDWFTGCDTDMDCFRQRMNEALGETDLNIRNGRSEAIIVAAAAVAAAAAFWVWRKR